MRTVTCIEDLRQTARRKVPRAFFDYAEAGSYSEATLRANREDLARIKLRQRVLVDVSQRDLATTIMGEKVSLPLALAPIERAAAAKCSALVLTVDLQVLGQRHCDIRNGMTVPPQIKLANVIDIATKPAWALSI